MNFTITKAPDYAANYKRGKGYCYSAFLQRNFPYNLALNFDYSYSKTAYERVLKRVGKDNFLLNYSEVIYSNELGLSVKKYLYKTDKGAFSLLSSYVKHPGRGPYISAGGYYTKMRQAQANVN